MLFQLVLTKFFKSELFSCLPKVDHVIKSCKEPNAAGKGKSFKEVENEPLRILFVNNGKR